LRRDTVEGATQILGLVSAGRDKQVASRGVHVERLTRKGIVTCVYPLSNMSGKVKVVVATILVQFRAPGGQS
jgi:hypothetical protein